MRSARQTAINVSFIAILLGAIFPASASAQGLERMCDPGWEDCRQLLIDRIRAENVGLDVAFWFMEDTWIASEVIARHRAKVPVRILMDTEANASNPRNAERLKEFKNAGIPMRERIASGILHWKMMLFAGQGIVQFSGANYSSDAWVYAGTPGTNYVDEAIYFTNDSDVVNSFRTKYDDLWTNTTQYANYANVQGPLARRYSTFPKDPELNFPPLESFYNRSEPHYTAETTKIDVTIYRITDQRHSNAMIAAKQRGVPVRIITEPHQYRDPNRLWHSWNIDRMYMAGIAIRNRAHQGLNHQKTTLLYGQQLAINGSSNWTSPSDTSQEEHNYFTRKPDLFAWLVNQFERKWNNGAGVAETSPFVPLPPDAATSPAPLSGTIDVPATGVTLKWHGGYWAHKYDVYFGTSANPPLLVADQMLGPSQSSVDVKQFPLPLTLSTGTRYYWKIVSKTMANQSATSQVWSFTTVGSAPPPPPPPPPGTSDIVLHAQRATIVGAWQRESDATAAGGARVRNPDLGAAKISTPSASPANYFELTFTAEAGVPYRLWLRGRADADYWANDSTFVQFSGSVDPAGAPVWRIGTTSATDVSIEECSGCGISGWGWQDNGWGAGVLGPLVYFATTGTQRVRIQTREDGLAIDQIVLSPSTYLNVAPGLNRNDTTILPEQTGGAPPPPPSDTDPPTAAITSPAAGATVSGTVSVSVNATDNVGVSRVEMLLDGALAATDTTAPYTFAWDTRAVSNGTHTLRARAVDAAGNVGLSTSVSVTVNNTTTTASEIVLWTADVTTMAGGWRLVQDTTAAGSVAIHHPDAGAAKLSAPLASPANYFEMTFTAQAGRPYRLWIRGKAEGNYWANDSVFVQFDRSVTSSGAAQWRIGTTSAAEYNLEECSGCGVSNWGWQDNGWGIGVMGPVVYFSTTGTQRLRIQTREDGLLIDQIVLSPETYLDTAPGPPKNATNILGKTQ